MTRHCCPNCATSLDGGPIVFHCGQCLRRVQAADLDLEFRPSSAAATSSTNRFRSYVRN